VVRLDFHKDGFGHALSQLIQDFLNNGSAGWVVRRWSSEGPHSLFDVLNQAFGIVRNYKLPVPGSEEQHLMYRPGFRLKAVVTSRPSEEGVFKGKTFFLPVEVVTAEFDSASQPCEQSAAFWLHF